MPVRQWLLTGISALLALVMLLSVACTKPAPTPTPTPSPKPAASPSPAPKPSPSPAPVAKASPKPSPAPSPKPPRTAWPKAIILTTPARGGGLNVYGSTVAGMIEKATRVVVTPQPTTGGLEAQELFAKGEAQMWANNAYDILKGYLGDRPKEYTTITKRARWFSGAYVSYVHFPVRANSKIMTFADLKGKRAMFDRPGTPLWWDVFPQVLKAYGLTEKDITVMPALAYRESADAIKTGSADTTLQYSAIPNPEFLELSQNTPIRLLSIDRDKQAQIVKDIPFESIAVIPANTYKGQTTDVFALNLVAPVAADANLPDDFIYAGIKAVIENFKDLQAAHALFKVWKPVDLAADPVIPYHAGALRAYKEAGLMKPEWEKKHFDLLKQMGQDK